MLFIFFIFACVESTFVIISKSNGQTSLSHFNPDLNEIIPYVSLPPNDVHVACNLDDDQTLSFLSYDSSARSVLLNQINLIDGTNYSVEEISIPHLLMMIDYDKSSFLNVSVISFDNVIIDLARDTMRSFQIASEYKIMDIRYRNSTHLFVMVYDTKNLASKLFVVDINLQAELSVDDVVVTYPDFFSLENFVDGLVMYSVMIRKDAPYEFYWVETDLLSGQYTEALVGSEIRCIVKKI